MIFFILMFIGIVFLAYAVAKFVVTKLKLEGSKKDLWTIITTIISIPILYVVTVLVIVFALSYYPSKTFNRKAWVENKNERYTMSANIIESKLLIGKTKYEVNVLLEKALEDFSDNEWTYDLGHVPGLFNMDIDVLSVRFKDNKVIAVKQLNS